MADLPTFRLITGDCLEAMAQMPEASVDAIVTDPPYGLEFMGKEWDRLTGVGSWAHGSTSMGIEGHRKPTPSFGSNRNPVCLTCHKHKRGTDRCRCAAPVWDETPADGNRTMQTWHQAWATEALRVLKPGGHLLAFGGTRTYHRLACAIEDAGFEIRDCLAWMYGSGFPKSLDVSKAIDKRREDNPDWRRVGAWLRDRRTTANLSAKAVCAAIGAHGDVNHGGAMSNWENGFACPTWDQWLDLQRIIGFGDEMDAEVWRLNGRKGTPGEAWEQREILGEASDRRGDGTVIGLGHSGELSRATSAEAQTWQGWGTALKPSHEPVVLARKPLVGTVAQNVLTFGTGALNIDGTRVRPEGDDGLWANGGSLCDSCAVDAVSPGRPGTPATRASTTPRRAARSPNGSGLFDQAATDKAATGCSDGTTEAGTSTSSSTAPSGSEPTAPSPLASSSTTSTETRATTDSATCSSCGEAITPGTISGRWPSNVILDEQAAAMLDEQTGERGGGFGIRGAGTDPNTYGGGKGYAGTLAETGQTVGYGDHGGASRFFYTSKASSVERNRGTEHMAAEGSTDEGYGSIQTPILDRATPRENWTPHKRVNTHPTVKPVDLMQWLVRLITPPGGVVLDPFTGSGSTGIAALREGFTFIGIEREPEYVEIARSRIVGDAPLFNVEVDA